jgi:hypothetical protein
MYEHEGKMARPILYPLRDVHCMMAEPERENGEAEITSPSRAELCSNRIYLEETTRRENSEAEIISPERCVSVKGKWRGQYYIP